MSLYASRDVTNTKKNKIIQHAFQITDILENIAASAWCCCIFFAFLALMLWKEEIANRGQQLIYILREAMMMIISHSLNYQTWFYSFYFDAIKFIIYAMKRRETMWDKRLWVWNQLCTNKEFVVSRDSVECRTKIKRKDLWKFDFYGEKSAYFHTHVCRHFL